MLYRQEDFEPLVDEPWDPERARRGIREIVADTDAALRGPKLLWPTEEWDRWRATSPLKGLYCGAAGVLWALADLREHGHAESTLPLDELALHTLERERARPDLGRWSNLPTPPGSALLSGEAGTLLVAQRLAPSTELADALHARVRENVANEAEDVMWGAPGSLVVARLMLAWTGGRRWRTVADELTAALLARQDADGLWTQSIQGQTFRGLGPVHGLVGNVQTLLPLLDARRRSRLVRDALAVLRRTAFVEGAHANWPPIDRETLASRNGDVRLQWCHGAPGVLTSARSYLDDELVVAGAQLTWSAGAHRDEKGASICHGTAGNGYGLLAAFERTGDELWLARARRFALHALAQARRLRAARGRGRYSLFTGDLGVALYLAACIDARTDYPILDA